MSKDTIYRQDAIDALAEDMPQPYTPDGSHPADEGIFMAQEIYADCIQTLKELPSEQPATNCSEIPNTSDFVSRKAVREMVSAWAYDLMEQEDLNMALHDVDELPTAQPEVIHCKDCKHRDPEDEKCDSGHAIQWQLPRSDDWFCADAEMKQK